MCTFLRDTYVSVSQPARPSQSPTTTIILSHSPTHHVVQRPLCLVQQILELPRRAIPLLERQPACCLVSKCMNEWVHESINDPHAPQSSVVVAEPRGRPNLMWSPASCLSIQDQRRVYIYVYAMMSIHPPTSPPTNHRPPFIHSSIHLTPIHSATPPPPHTHTQKKNNATHQPPVRSNPTSFPSSSSLSKRQGTRLLGGMRPERCAS